MAQGEFDLIRRYFQPQNNRKDVVVGIGDDAAVLNMTPGTQLVVSTDTLVSGIHFLPDIDPATLAYKALVVNLSDLAAMGAQPCWVSLALTIPQRDDNWLESFSNELQQLCDYYGVTLIGGDTTRGPMSITITAHGQVQAGKALRRNGARSGDWIYVTGHLGDSGMGLKLLLNEWKATPSNREFLIERHLKPKPQLLAGLALRGHASSCLDLSDGLASDLGHILSASDVGARINLDAIPLSKALLQTVTRPQALQLALGGGEDYQLLFTLHESQKGAVSTLLGEAGVNHVCIGQITGSSGIEYYQAGQACEFLVQGFEHF